MSDADKQTGRYVIAIAKAIGKIESKEQALMVMRALLLHMETISDLYGEPK